MRTTINKSKRLITIAAALIVALLAVAVGLIVRNRPAEAATNGTITIHVYDPQKDYRSNVYAWIWTDGEGTACQISSSAASNEQFKFSNDTYSNTAYTVKYNATAAEITKLNNGAVKLGLIMGVLNGSVSNIWEGDNFKKDIDENAFIDMTGAFGSGSAADVYYIRRDTTGYTKLQEAKEALNSVIGVRFSDVTSSGVKVVFSAARPLTGTTVDLYKNGVKVDTANAQQNGADECACIVTFSDLNLSNFDYSANYQIRMTVDGTESVKSVSSSTLLDTVGFIKTFETADTQNREYGAIYTKTSTTFRVWAPLAAAVKLRIYDKGEGGSPASAYDMTKRNPDSWGGVWEYTLDGDQNGKYYTYVVNNYGKDTETIDPYAKACGANGKRGMVVDLDSTDPLGWENDKHLYATNAAAADNPVVWEVSVNDFSSSSDSGMRYKGKYLAFTETGTKVPGTDLKTGVDYLKDLGITYVHLNPVYDFATVDEADMTRADSGEFNWGYDPQNYNIPEGSFSTDPANGNVRINEFKQMVMALHKAGIGVVMDVVYNHTYATSGQALHDTVPYYYHRTNEDGRLTNDSGCGNGTASERSMMRKYIVESILYWATEYHIDGFRFDLMGIHDVTTVNMVRSTLSALDGGKGKALLIYGEPWSADGGYKAPSFTNRINATQSTIAGTGKYTSNSGNDMLKFKYFSAGDGDPTALNALDPRVAIFNDSGRNGLRGECKDRAPTQGWVNGVPGEIEKVRRMIEGGVGDYAKGLHTGLGSRNVAYAAAHDNYTLWDQICGEKHGNQSALFYDFVNPDHIRRCQLVAAAYLANPGIAFMIAGEEMGRTKYGNENSYNSPTKLNTITWSRQAQFADLYNFYKGVIALRRANTNTLFSYTKAAASADYSKGNFGSAGPDLTTGAFTFTRTQGGATLTLSLDPSTLTGSFRIGSTAVTVKANG